MDVSAIDTVKALLNSLRSGYANIKVRAYVVMPIRWFGIVSVFTVERSIETSKTVPIKLQLPGGSAASMVRVINAWFEPAVVSVGTPVKVNVELYSESTGKFDVKILIRQDRAFAMDVTVYEYRKVLEFEGTTTLSFTWIPSQASASGIRGYYVEVYVNDNKIYSMPSEYPPRLKVLAATTTTYVSPTPTSTSVGFLEVTDVYWLVNNYRTYEAQVGDYVKACVIIRAVGGNVRASVTIKIRGDYRGLPDKTFTEQTFYVSLNSGQEKVLTLVFTASKATGTIFRGYYIEVYVNGEKYYAMPSDYPPRLKVLG